MFPVSAAILNLLYITGRRFTRIRCARVSPFTVYAKFREICTGTLSYKGVTWTGYKSRFCFWITTSRWRQANLFWLHGWRRLVELNTLWCTTVTVVVCLKATKILRGVKKPSCTFAWPKQELIRRWDSERELFYNIAHVEASAYAHWTSS